VSGQDRRCLRGQGHADKPEQGGKVKAECQEGRQAKEPAIGECRLEGSKTAPIARGEMDLDGER
jgi:hypothetical protein